ncbi:MAG: GyrI-like domain-containing protein [Eubacteriales bacterium]
MDKIDFKKKFKSLYSPSSKQPSIVDVPAMNFAVLEGVGNPNNSKLFADSIEALFGLSYTISMSYKGDALKIPNFCSYTVPPLEGIWDLVNYEDFNKDNFKWTIGIMQPEFVTIDIFEKAKEIAYDKKKNELIKNIALKTVSDGLCCTFMHIGSYDDEKASFSLMEEYAEAQGYKRAEKIHREIYLNDFRKVPPEKLKTVLRFKVTKQR